MNTISWLNKKTIITIVLLLVGVVLAVGYVRAHPISAPSVSIKAPHIVSYQGRVLVDGSPYNGTGYFKFTIVNESATATYWASDGHSPPLDSIPLNVVNGQFHIDLGDTSLPNMVPLVPGIFIEPDRFLQVWFSSDDANFTTLPVTRIASVPYALVADTLDGKDSTEFSSSSHNHDGRYFKKFNNVIVVAKSGGDFGNLGEALKSITDAAANNPYLIWIAPGVYVEKEPPAMLPYVHIQGAGQEVTQLVNAESAVSNPPTSGSLMLASHSSLRDLTVVNQGDGPYNTAILAKTGVTDTLVTDVTVKAEGSGDHNYAIYLTGEDVKVHLENVRAVGTNGTLSNRAMMLHANAQAVVHGGEYHAYGYQSSALNIGFGAVLSATHVTGIAEGSPAWGLHAFEGGKVYLEGGSLSVIGGRSGYHYGIATTSANTTLLAKNVQVTIKGEATNIGTLHIYGLRNTNAASANLEGVVFSVEGDEYTYGISNEGSLTLVKANNVHISAKGEENVYGLNNAYSSELRGGYYYAEGTENVYGIYSAINTLRANNVRAQGKFGAVRAGGLWVNSGNAILVGGEYIGEVGSGQTFGIGNLGSLYTTETTATGIYGLDDTYGLLNTGYAQITGGNFIADNGFGGVNTYGILNETGDLEASEVTAIGRNADSESYGLHNTSLGKVNIKGGSFTGMDGSIATGISNEISGTVLIASDFVAKGEGASGRNVGLYNYFGGKATVSNASLVGAGGNAAIGIENSDQHSWLQATSVLATAKGAKSNAYGLSNAYAATSLIDNSTFMAQEAVGDALGIFNYRGTVQGTHITARGLDAEGSGEGVRNSDKSNPTLVELSHCVLEGDNYSLNVQTPTILLRQCQFIGTTTGTSGTTSCVASTQGYTWFETTCP